MGVVNGQVLRHRSAPLGTPGGLTLENGFSCDTLEKPWHNNERGRSCTAPGIDVGRVWWSPHLKRAVIKYDDRNSRVDCEIHNGNFAAEEVDLDDDHIPEITNVHGCTLVGHGYGNIKRKDGRLQWGIMVSGATLAGLIDSLAIPGEDHVVGSDGYISGYHSVRIEYAWAPGAEP